LRRLFGEPGQQVLLEFRRFSPSTDMQVSVTSDGIRRGISSPKYRFGPNGEWKVGRNPLRMGIGKEFEGFTFGGSILPEPEKPNDEEETEPSFDSADAALLTQAFTAASDFSVSGGFRRGITLKTGRLLAPHRAMEKCLDELLTHWGIDAQAQKSLTRNATPVNANRVARNVGYPPSMLMTNEPGLIRVRLAITEAGTVRSCHVQLDISNPAFERSACSDLKDAKFHPALDKDGRPIASYWVTAIIYEPG
jgi:hypothetical protein